MGSSGTRKPQHEAHQPRSEEPEPASAPSSEGDRRVTRFRWAEDDYVVLSYPPATPPPSTGLTASEQAVFLALLAGQSNREIAESRGRSQRTVANQVASIFHKLGVGSRAELVAKHSGRR